MNTVYSKKFKLLISPTCVTSEIIRDILVSRYDIIYCGIYTYHDKFLVYIQNKSRISKNIVEKLLSETLDILDISVFSKVEGTLICEYGTIPKHGGKREAKKRSETKNISQNITNNNCDQSTNTYVINQNIIVVNPIGSETTDHITQEFIQDLLDQGLGRETVFHFGTKMYSELSNMNFITDRKDGYVKGRVGENGEWLTLEKDPAYEMLFDNLSNKNLEVVENFKDGLSDESVDGFHETLKGIEFLKKVNDVSSNKAYKKYVKEGFNVMAENMKDKTRRMSRDSGKRVKLM